MFQTENEDMLPRAAPRASAGLPIGHMEIIAKPTVPEVSLLFGQQTNANKIEIPQKLTSYAAWKKQTLPRVTFPATLATELGSNNAFSSNGSSPSCSGSSSSRNGSSPSCNGTNSTTTTQLTGGSSLSSSNVASTNMHPFAYGTVSSNEQSIAQAPQVRTTNDYNFDQFSNYNKKCYQNTMKANIQYNGKRLSEQTPLQRRSFDVAQLRPASNNVLTICAGTQTEPICISSTLAESDLLRLDTNHLVTKQDITELQHKLEQMKNDQMRLLQICEILLHQSRQSVAATKPIICLKEVAVQCDLLTSNNALAKRQTPITHSHIPEKPEMLQGQSQQQQKQQQHKQQEQEQQQQEIVQEYNQIKYNLPRATPPTAQSTAYRQNTPQAKRLSYAPANNVATVLPKPITEKSMAMNELALKYLPQEKLAELLQELHMSPNNVDSPIQVSPLRPIENYTERSPTDISNASYKYLKKYRLLPEEQMDYPMTNTPQRNTPYNVGRGSPGMIDLEHIRNQPKLL